MFPLRDTIQSKNYPVANTAIIAVNVLVFLLQTGQGEGLGRFLLTYGLVPARYSDPRIAAYFPLWQQIFSFCSFMFLHGGFWHLLGNMWFLYIFGDNVEDRLGSVRYVFFYILCGFLSGLSHMLVNWHSQVPTIGASGAIAGVMGAYFLLYPASRILTFIPIFIIPYFLELPAFFFLGAWFLLQFLSAAGTHGQGGGIAWWAHIGGFLFGMVLLQVFLKFPETGITHRIRRKTVRQKTPRLQKIHVAGAPGDAHLYGEIHLTPKEAFLGTRKLVNIPWGFQKRLFRVHVPPGIRDGSTLRLPGMGRQEGPGRRGDLYLKVRVREGRDAVS